MRDEFTSYFKYYLFYWHPLPLCGFSHGCFGHPFVHRALHEWGRWCPQRWVQAVDALSCTGKVSLCIMSDGAGSPWPSFLCARKATAEGNMRSQSTSGQGILSSGCLVQLNVTELSDPSASLSCPLWSSPPWAAHLGFRPRFLTGGLSLQLREQANVSWWHRSSSSVRKPRSHLQHW